MLDIIIAGVLAVLLFVAFMYAVRLNEVRIQHRRSLRIGEKRIAIAFADAMVRVEQGRGLLVVDNTTSHTYLYWLDNCVHPDADLYAALENHGHLIFGADQATANAIEEKATNDFPLASSSVRCLHESAFIDFD